MALRHFPVANLLEMKFDLRVRPLCALCLRGFIP
jgi:hypothetical protein